MLKFFSSHRIIPFIVSLSFFMEAVDSSIINTAIPAMARSLAVDPVDLKVALISYLLSLAIFIPISGWIADKYGSKKIFIIALFIFTLSSLWCGFAHNLPELVIARLIQGFGGALNLPVGRLIIVRTFERNKLISTMNRVVTVGALGVMLGPVIGGFITHYFNWNWIFWVNIPVGLLAIVLASIFLPFVEPQKVPPLDKLGFVYFGAGLAGITFGLSSLSETTASSSMTFGIILLSVLLMFAYYVHSHRKAHPIVKTDLLRFRTFRVSILGNLISRLGFGGVPFLIPLLLQIGFGFPAQVAGMLLAPIAIGILLIKPFALPLLRLLGYKRLLIWNTLVAGISIWSFTLISAHTPIYIICFLTFFYGFVLSLQYSAMNSLAYADVSSENLSAATSIMSTLQQISQSFGVAVSALFIRFFSSLFAGQATLTATIFHYTFFGLGFFTFLSAFIFLRLDPDDGSEMLAS